MRLKHLNEVLKSEDKEIKNLDKTFHDAIKSLFFWQEFHRLLSDMACLVQRFLIVLCLRKEEEEFINVKDITPLIVKLLYCIKATVFTELIKRNERNEDDIRIDKDLSDMRAYMRDLIQSSFDFLREMMHLAATIAGDMISLSQIY